VIEQSGAVDENQEKDAVLAFIKSSGYDAFTDHPTRKYYKEIASIYPDAYIINTIRSRDPLRLSASKYLGLDEVTVDEWIKVHFEQEAEIASFFEANPQHHYLAINICEDNQSTSSVKTFLGINNQPNLLIGKENQSNQVFGTRWLDELPASVQMQLGYYKLFTPPPCSDLQTTAEYLELCCKPGKSLPSESSHHYLINDASHSIRQYFGLKSPEGKSFIADTRQFDDLADACDKISAHYRVIAIPEKYSIYPEHLPSCLVGDFLDEIKAAIDIHPSRLVETSTAYYVNTCSYLQSKKSFGDLYFHGDTHLSSIGSYHIVKIINAIMLNMLDVTLSNIPDAFDRPVLGSWLGDLAEQTPEDLRSYMEQFFSHNKNLPIDASGFKNTSYIVYYPPEFPANVLPEPYLKFADKYLSASRPKTRYTNLTAPIRKKVVVFRDSTATSILPSLTMLYEEIVSVWDRAFHLRRDIILEEKPDFVLVITADRFICRPT
jgi:hypothetical protein